MSRKIFTAVLLLAPTIALALNYSDVSSEYRDAPFSRPEAIAISVLTNIGAVRGNPDGTFMPKRTLNRAEFAKIVALIITQQQEFEDTTCFPDVRTGQWFAAYVCFLRDLGSIGGNPDGYYHPERSVNYAEALKILTVAFGYDIPELQRGEAWYQRYAEAAKEHGTTLPINLAFDAQLTRGQMARLAAAFYAEQQGDLENYRRAEQRLPPAASSSSSSSSSSESSSSSSSSSTSSTSSSSSSAAYNGFPVRSRFLIAGERSLPVAGISVFANLEPVFLLRAEVKLENEIEGIDSMYVVDENGTELAQLSLDKVFDPNEKTWRGIFVRKGNRIEKAEQKIFGVEVRMKARNQGGTSEELVEVDTFKITVEGEWSTETYTSGSDVGPFPMHQTSMGRIRAVRNAQEETSILPLGPGQQLASFAITGFAVDQVTNKIEHLEFQVSKSPLVNIANWQLGIPDSNERLACSTSDSTVNCLNIPESLGTLSGSNRTFRLFGDVSLSSGATDKNVQISLNLAGNIGTNGAIRWSDGSGHFNWVELDQPLARSTLWK